MSWNGAHPKISKAAARASLHPGACRSCIYYARVFSAAEERDRGGCWRCGNPPLARLRWVPGFTQRTVTVTDGVGGSHTRTVWEENPDPKAREFVNVYRS